VIKQPLCWAKKLEDSDRGVRWDALCALEKVVQKGNQFAINQVCTRLDHPNPDVRRTAIRAVSRVAAPGDLYAIRAVTKYLHHEERYVRKSAAEALGHLGDTSGIKYVDTLQHCAT